MSYRVLIVDDAGFVREILSQVITKAGHEVIGEAKDGIEAVKLTQQLKPDVIFLDLVLPLKNGVEAAFDIKQFLPKTRLVAVSAIDQQFLQTKAREAGCEFFLKKPFTRQNILDLFQQISGTQRGVVHG